MGMAGEACEGWHDIITIISNSKNGPSIILGTNTIDGDGWGAWANSIPCIAKSLLFHSSYHLRLSVIFFFFLLAWRAIERVTKQLLLLLLSDTPSWWLVTSLCYCCSCCCCCEEHNRKSCCCCCCCWCHNTANGQRSSVARRIFFRLYKRLQYQAQPTSDDGYFNNFLWGNIIFGLLVVCLFVRSVRADGLRGLKSKVKMFFFVIVVCFGWKWCRRRRGGERERVLSVGAHFFFWLHTIEVM